MFTVTRTKQGGGNLPFLHKNKTKVMPITSGLALNCGISCSGGQKRLWLANKEDIDTITFGADGEVTAITMVGTGVFYAVELKRNTKGFTENTTDNDGSGCNYSVTQTFTGNGQCKTQNSRSFLKELVNQSCCGIVGINEYNTGRVELWGHLDELHIRVGSGTQFETGVALTDASQFILELICDTTIDGLATEFTPGTGGIPV